MAATTNKKTAGEVRHTPGPYYFDGKWVRAVATDGLIARICNDDGHASRPTKMPEQANGNLLAAAPDLLAALRAMVEADDAHWPLATAQSVRETARAAIAKAIPEGYRMLSVEEHVETIVSGFAHHTTLELAGTHKTTAKVKHWAIVTCVRKGNRLRG